MSTVNSFGTRTALVVGGPDVSDVQLAGARARGLPRNCPAPVFPENPAREPASPRGRPLRQGRRHGSAGALGRQGRRAEGDLVRAGARASPGFHRRAGGRRSRGDARRHRAARRRSQQGQPAAAGRARDRSLGAGRLFRPGERVSAERRARVLAQQGALRVPALGPGRLRQLPRRPTRHRHRPPGEPRVSRARDHDGRIGRGHARVPRHAGRHRLAHDDGERSGRDGMGRRRHRSRSGDARSADLDADSAGRSASG